MKDLTQAYCQERIVTNSPLLISLKKDISCGCKCKHIYHFVILDFPTWSNICEKPKYCCKHQKTTIPVFPVGTRRGSFALFAYIFNMLNNLKNVTLFKKFFWSSFSLSFSFHIICCIFLRKIRKRKTFLFFFFFASSRQHYCHSDCKRPQPGILKTKCAFWYHRVSSACLHLTTIPPPEFLAEGFEERLTFRVAAKPISPDTGKSLASAAGRRFTETASRGLALTYIVWRKN